MGGKALAEVHGLEHCTCDGDGAEQKGRVQRARGWKGGTSMKGRDEVRVPMQAPERRTWCMLCEHGRAGRAMPVMEPWGHEAGEKGWCQSGML